jgi:hypothetical protein
MIRNIYRMLFCRLNYQTNRHCPHAELAILHNRIGIRHSISNDLQQFTFQSNPANALENICRSMQQPAHHTILQPPSVQHTTTVYRLRVGPKRGAWNGANLGSMGIKLRTKLIMMKENVSIS